MPTEIVEVFARVWRQLDAMQTALFIVLLVLVGSLFVVLVRSLLDALRQLAGASNHKCHQVKRWPDDQQKPLSVSIKPSCVALSLCAQAVGTTCRASHPSRRIFCVGWVIGLLLGALLAAGLALILRGA